MHCCRGTGARQLQAPPHRHPCYSLPRCLVIASIARASGAAEPLTIIACSRVAGIRSGGAPPCPPRVERAVACWAAQDRLVPGGMQRPLCGIAFCPRRAKMYCGYILGEGYGARLATRLRIWATLSPLGRARWRPAMFANWLDLFEAATAADFFVPEVASRFASAAHR